MSEPAPPRVREYADEAVAYVQRALGVRLEFDSNTLPVLDHYLRSVPADQPAALKLVVLTAAAYFGEVVRHVIGGRWELGSTEPEWRLVLPTGLNFSPAGFVAAAIAQADLEDFDSEINAPARILPYVQQALGGMGEFTVEEYYSLCGRLDTLEHLHEVLVAVAAQMMGEVSDPDDPDGNGQVAREEDDTGPPRVIATADEPSGPVN
jgi:hypothetical protein